MTPEAWRRIDSALRRARDIAKAAAAIDRIRAIEKAIGRGGPTLGSRGPLPEGCDTERLRALAALYGPHGIVSDPVRISTIFTVQPGPTLGGDFDPGTLAGDLDRLARGDERPPAGADAAEPTITVTIGGEPVLHLNGTDAALMPATAERPAVIAALARALATLTAEPGRAPDA